ncbi:hypothetical protein [Hymenobacter sp. DG25A]|uniref:hypothetical protein n=1 Tax=Hymenobacter sp. DG25A TaxID=1385663 RepID=UPI0006BD1F01|nr:hypothetical protein [Hymenobacter sp. DG25A]ALD20863.1 hypothetical protein AM218_06030 [Hymenobacter sp. DG25A]
MKKILCFSWLLAGSLAFCGAAQAQTAPASEAPSTGKPAFLRLGLGTAYDIEGYYRSARVSVEYAPMLSRRIGLASRVVGLVGKPTSGMETQLPNQNYKGGYLEQEVVFYPFENNQRLNLGLGAGGFAGFYRLNGFDHYTAVDGKFTEYQLERRQGFHGGYLLSLNLDVALGETKRWRVGTKATLQNGAEGNRRASTYNLTLARRL